MRRTHTVGFTLIELLITLGMFATLMAGITGLLWSASRAQKEAAQLGEVDRLAKLIIRQLTRDLQGCVLTTSRYHESTGFLGTDLSENLGDADKVQFVTSAGRIDFGLDWNSNDQELLRRTNLAEVEYRLDLDPTTDEVGLYRREKLLLTTLATDEEEIWLDRLLAPEVTSFSLRYGSGKGDWADTWDSKQTEKRPRVVELQLEIDLGYQEQTDKTIIEARDQEEEGARYFGRGKFYTLIRLPIDGMPTLDEEESEGSGE